jgi:hypothetical protein
MFSLEQNFLTQVENLYQSTKFGYN